MGSALAIACVTAVLKSILANGLADPATAAVLNDAPIVTALPPDRVVTGESEPTQLNLFLYHVSPSTALRPSGLVQLRQLAPVAQLDDRHQPKSGSEQIDEPPLVVDLHYVLTAYSSRQYEIEVLLGDALQLFHRRRLLDAAAIKQVLDSLSTPEDRRIAEAVAKAPLSAQVQQIMIEARFIDSEELSRLWSALQSRYRPSIFYKVAAVLAEVDEQSTPSDDAER